MSVHVHPHVTSVKMPTSMSMPTRMSRHMSLFTMTMTMSVSMINVPWFMVYDLWPCEPRPHVDKNKSDIPWTVHFDRVVISIFTACLHCFCSSVSHHDARHDSLAGCAATAGAWGSNSSWFQRTLGLGANSAPAAWCQNSAALPTHTPLSYQGLRQKPMQQVRSCDKQPKGTRPGKWSFSPLVGDTSRADVLPYGFLVLIFFFLGRRGNHVQWTALQHVARKLDTKTNTQRKQRREEGQVVRQPYNPATAHGLGNSNVGQRPISNVEIFATRLTGRHASKLGMAARRVGVLKGKVM